MGYLQIKTFCIAKENSIKIKREPTVWENILANDTSEKDLISKIYKELRQLHSKKGSAGVGWRDGEKRHTTVIE